MKNTKALNKIVKEEAVCFSLTHLSQVHVFFEIAPSTYHRNISLDLNERGVLSQNYILKYCVGGPEM
jgi:hypothetical protein